MCFIVSIPLTGKCLRIVSGSFRFSNSLYYVMIFLNFFIDSVISLLSSSHSDRWASFIFGKPHTITDINVSVPLPTLANFDPMTRDFFISFLKLSRILGSIWNFGYSSQPKASLSTWSEQAMDEKSPLRQIRGALAKWLKELPDSLQYQYLPSTDSRDIFRLANFTPFAGM